MRILVIHCAYQYQGGEDMVVKEEMELLRSDGHDVELLLFSNEGNALLKMLQLPFNIASYFATRKRVNRFKPHIVHIHNLHFAASPSVIYAVKHCGIPMVMTLHNYRLLCPSGMLYNEGKLFLDSLTQRFPVSAVKKGVYKNSRLITFWLALSTSLHYWLKTYQLPERLICLTPHAKTLFRSSTLQPRSGQITIKPNFISLNAKNVMPRGEHFLFVGRLSEEKGIRLLLDTFALSNLTILIVGDGPLKTLVSDYATRYANIYYVGKLLPADVHSAMLAASALVFPSVWYEGMPLTIIEAFACKLPVIAANLGAMQSMVENDVNGLLFEPDSKADLQRALYKWAHFNNEEKNWCRWNARSTYDNEYSPEKNLRQLLHIYKEVLVKDNVPLLSFV